jgi:MFS family permease
VLVLVLVLVLLVFVVQLVLVLVLVLVQQLHQQLLTPHQVLVGPAFVATFSTTLLVMGVAADNFHRPLVFAIGTLVFSVSCLLQGLATSYWQLLATRWWWWLWWCWC